MALLLLILLQVCQYIYATAHAVYSSGLRDRFFIHYSSVEFKLAALWADIYKLGFVES
jgi:hypothetical protein